MLDGNPLAVASWLLSALLAESRLMSPHPLTAPAATSAARLARAPGSARLSPPQRVEPVRSIVTSSLARAVGPFTGHDTGTVLSCTGSYRLRVGRTSLRGGASPSRRAGRRRRR